MERHPFDVVSFLFGALFIAAGVTAVLYDRTSLGIDGRWVWPVVLLVAGVAVLGATLRPRWRRAVPGDDAAEPDSPIS